MVYDWEGALEKCEFLVALYIKDTPIEAPSRDRFRYYLEDSAINICCHNSLDDINRIWKMFMDGKINATKAVKYLSGEIKDEDLH